MRRQVESATSLTPSHSREPYGDPMVTPLIIDNESNGGGLGDTPEPVIVVTHTFSLAPRRRDAHIAVARPRNEPRSMLTRVWSRLKPVDSVSLSQTEFSTRLISRNNGGKQVHRKDDEVNRPLHDGRASRSQRQRGNDEREQQQHGGFLVNAQR